MNTVAGSGSSAVVGEGTTSLFQASRSEVIIGRSASDVWAVLTDLSCATFKLWNPEVIDVEHISGERRKVNEYVLVRMSTLPEPFHMRTIRIVPNHVRVLRCDPIDRSYAAFVDHSLYELDSSTTKVTCNLYGERRIPSEQAKTFDFAEAAESVMKYLDDLFVRLRDVVEKKPGKVDEPA